MNQDGSRSDRQRLLIPLLWIGLLVSWTWLLLLPLPRGTVLVVGGPENMLTIGKTLHVSVYAVLAILTAGLPPSFGPRILLATMLVVHGGVTEYLQDFVGRRSSVRDFLLDAFGVAIGMGLGLVWRWRGRVHARRESSQKQFQPNRRDQHADAADL